MADKIITLRDKLKITYVIFIYYLYLPLLGGDKMSNNEKNICSNDIVQN